MNPLRPLPPVADPTDSDMAEQANPGLGVPSQDPDTAAQTPLDPKDAEREANSVLVGGGAMAGAATGAAVGVAVAGPVGVLIGASLGAVAGAVGGAAAGAAANSANQDTAPASSAHLHIEDSGGDGRPVVLIHGWPLSAMAWEPQVAVLQGVGFRVVTYDRRGFGRSDKPESGYSYDDLADDLQRVLDQCKLQDVTLVGFSMGGGEVARYVARYGEALLRSVVFAAAVPPYLMKTTDNPDGPLTPEAAQQTRRALELDRDAFFDQFAEDFYSANGVFLVTESQRREAIAMCHQSAQPAALACMDAFGTTDFREDLKQLTVPTLVIHGDADGIVPIEGSGLRTHQAVRHSQLVTVSGARQQLINSGINRGAPQPVGDSEWRTTRPERIARAGLQRCVADLPTDVSTVPAEAGGHGRHTQKRRQALFYKGFYAIFFQSIVHHKHRCLTTCPRHSVALV